MSKFKKNNLLHIKTIFEDKTGVELNPGYRPQGFRPVRATLILTAVMLLILTMAAFTQPIFSGLAEDPLRIEGTYTGNGVVSIYVENNSDKPLKFQKKVKLIRWITSEEVPLAAGKVTFENTEFPPHSSGTMTVDFSDACDVGALEHAPTNTEVYYLLLTNQNFLFGNDWMCSFRFVQQEDEPRPQEIQSQISIPSENAENTEASLKFYFEEAYTGPLRSNEVHLLYQEKVDTLLAGFDGDVVSSLSPSIMVVGPSEYLDPEPMLQDIPDGIQFDASIPEDQQHYLTSWEWSYTDGYGRFVATAGEQALVHTALLPQYQELKDQADGGVTIPLVFYMVYDADRASDPGRYAFVYGRLLSFEEMEQYKVLHDDHYAFYDVTALIYTDVDAYLDYFLTTRTDVYCDDQIRQRVHNIYDFYQDKAAAAELIYYREP